MNEQILYTAAVSFEAARRLERAVPGQAQGLHGHSFQATLSARAAADGSPDWASFPGGEIDALRALLRAAVVPLDYQLLNDHVETPTDENLARWVRARAGGAEVTWAGVRSTPAQGVDIDASGHAHGWRRYQFEAAHRLPRVPPGHKCGRMHGHGFAVVLHAQGADAQLLDRLWAPLHQQLHHACLNDVHGLENPTSELIASWIWGHLQPQLPALRWVTVFETATCGAHFDGAHYRIWKEFDLDSAVRLRHAPPGDARQRIHGHSYGLRLHLAAPLDAVLGWTIDFGDVKEVFAPVFARLDHHPLHEIPGVAEAGAVAIARWAYAAAVPALPQLARIDLHETPGCGVNVSWGAPRPTLPW